MITFSLNLIKKRNFVEIFKLLKLEAVIYVRPLNYWQIFESANPDASLQMVGDVRLWHATSSSSSCHRNLFSKSVLEFTEWLRETFSTKHQRSGTGQLHLAQHLLPLDPDICSSSCSCDFSKTENLHHQMAERLQDYSFHKTLLVLLRHINLFYSDLLYWSCFTVCVCHKIIKALTNKYKHLWIGDIFIKSILMHFKIDQCGNLIL